MQSLRTSFELGDGYNTRQGNSLPSSPESRYASSHFEPRTLAHYEQHLAPRSHSGYLEKLVESKGDAGARWVRKFCELRGGFFTEKEGGSDGERVVVDVPMDRVTRVASYTMDKNAFEITYRRGAGEPSLSFVYRAADAEGATAWLFAFHRAIARLLSTLSVRNPNDGLLSGLDLGHGHGRNCRARSNSTHKDSRGASGRSARARDAIGIGSGSQNPEGRRHSSPPAPTADVEDAPRAAAQSGASAPRGDDAPEFGFGTRMDLGPGLGSGLGSGLDAGLGPGFQGDLASPAIPIPPLSQPFEASESKYVPPHLRQGKYVPPHRRSESAAAAEDSYMDPFFGLEEEECAWQRCGDGLKVCSSASTMLGPRSTNEDRLVLDERFLGSSPSGEEAARDGSEAQLRKEPHVGLFGVFDGHGGSETAQFIADNAAALLRERLGGPGVGTESAARAVAQTIRDLEDRWRESAAPRGCNSGSTCLLLLLLRGSVVVGNVGDSMAVCGRGSLAVCMNKPHSPGDERERERIRESGGWVTEEQELFIGQLHRMDLNDPMIRNSATQKCKVLKIYRLCGELAVSRAIGDEDFKGFRPEGEKVEDDTFWLFPPDHPRVFRGDLVSSEPDVSVRDLHADDRFIVLACDGFWDVVEPQECVDFVWKRVNDVADAEPEERLAGEIGADRTHISLNRLPNPRATAEAIAEELADLAIRSGSSDNVTVLLLFLDQDPES